MLYDDLESYKRAAHKDIDIDLYRRCAPRAGYWLGVLPNHPEIDPLRMNPPPGHAAQPPYPVAPVQAGGHPIGYPPPYPFPPGIPPAVQVQAAQPRTVREDISRINLSIPLNTNVVGGIVTQTPFQLPVDLPFEDFFSRLCAKMELEPLDAQLGYKFSGDRKTDVPFRLANEEDL